MHFPCLVYKVPGPHGPKPGYKFHGCADAEQWEVLRGLGWRATKAEAQGKDKADEIVAIAEDLAEATDAVNPGTREELEGMAKELGLPFNKRTSDEVLLARLSEATA